MQALRAGVDADLKGGASDLRGGSFVDIGVLEQSHFELQGQHALHGPVDLRFGDVARFRGLAE